MSVYCRRIYYLSAVGTQAELRSIKAGLVTGKKIHVPYLGSISHKSGEPWRDFTTAIPNSPFTHYLWVSADPAFVFVSDPAAAVTVAVTNRYERHNGEKAFQDAAKLTAAPEALYRSLDATTLPIPHKWAQTLFAHASRYNKLLKMDHYGDCVYAAVRDLELGAWKTLITQLVQKGELS